MGDTAPLAHGTRVFASEPVTGRLRRAEGVDDVLAMLDDAADDLVVLVRDAGATFLSPIFADLRGIVCTGGTPASHIGIVSREFHVPCIMGAVVEDELPPDGTTVELDCSSEPGVLRAR